MVLLSNPWYAVTLLGAPELWVMFAVLVFVIHIGMKVINRSKKDRKTKRRLHDLLFLLVPTIIITLLVVMALKGLLDVPRQCVPCLTELAGCNPYCPMDSSLPSGHSAIAAAGFTAIWLFGGRKKEWLWIYIIPILVMVSRIMLGVHTWLDVVAGAVLGIAIGFVVKEIDKKI